MLKLGDFITVDGETKEIIGVSSGSILYLSDRYGFMLTNGLIEGWMKSDPLTSINRGYLGYKVIWDLGTAQRYKAEKISTQHGLESKEINQTDALLSSVFSASPKKDPEKIKQGEWLSGAKKYSTGDNGEIENRSSGFKYL